MRQALIDLIKSKPRHYAAMVRRDPGMLAWVTANSLVPLNDSNTAECIYSAVYQQHNICDRGGTLKFRDITRGYGFCGAAGKCPCARDSTAAQVSASKQQYSRAYRDEINKKRQATNLERYGVINSGQTAHAVNRHRQHYESRPKKSKPPVLSAYARMAKKYLDLAIEFVTPESQYTGVTEQKYYDFRCLTCGHQFSTYIDNGHRPQCRVCYPTVASYVSQQETQVYDFVKSQLPGLAVERSNKTLINPYELDIIIPDKKIAIEYCGLYWHSDEWKTDPGYHKKKLDLCTARGYRLVTIFEDEWLNKKHAVKSRLENILGVQHKIYARRCVLEEISGDKARAFVDQHHTQGTAQASINLGCYHQGQLVAVMTFGRPRYNKSHEYELIRYCSQGTVVGGAGRLFRYFCQKYRPKSVISYCDLRWGTGGMYAALGFTRTNDTAPGYAYTDFVNRQHRSKFTKKSLVAGGADRNLTETEIMRSRGFRKIWDCGNAVYVWKP